MFPESWLVVIVIGSTLTAFAMGDQQVWGSWLQHAETMREMSPDSVQFFAAIEVDARGLEPFGPLLERLESLGGLYWTYQYDDGRTAVDALNRLRHIVAGRNMIQDYALVQGATHILFLDADLMPPEDCIPKLLEMDHPIVGGDVPTYCLGGPTVDQYSFPVQRHMNTAGFLLVHVSVFQNIRWRWTTTGLSDDPCYHYDVLTYLSLPTYVRKDVVGEHWPRHIPNIEARGYDMTVVR